MAGLECDLCIVGGGPAGMIAALLFARAGVRTIVLEKHGDFLRDFRGDTVHPSTLRIFDELGLLDRLLERPHNKVRQLGALIGGQRVEIGDFFSGFDPRWNFVALMPQWEFLDFVAGEARAYPGFRLLMEAEGQSLLVEQGRVSGVSYRSGDALHELRSRLVIVADGRGSSLREQAGLTVHSIGAPMDVFWFRLPKAATAENQTTGVITGGRILALLDRGDYWQCAFVFAKGQAEALRDRGLEALREEVARIAPPVADAVSAIRSWDDLKLLTVSLDRLDRWHRPGLLVIGDAAHAMSPIGGVGINVAIQDAVAAANILAGPLARGGDVDALLGQVEARRRLPVRLVQEFQNAAQKRIIGRVLARPAGPVRPPLIVRLLSRFALLRRIPAAFIGYGFRAEHVRSPDAGLRRAGSPPPSPLRG
jgi:2-polyprenyl-6-methoxyphenol hydroxylase-like FAD-dependent oxidoreductase